MKRKHGLNVKDIFRFAVLVAAAIAVTVTATAEFTKSYRAKRVVAAYATEGMLFSSNHLQASVEPTYSTVWVDRSDAADETIQSFDNIITICNYAQGNPTKYYGKTINYTLTTAIVQLVKTDNGDGTESVSIQPYTGAAPAVKIDGQPMQSSYSGSLLEGRDRENAYTLSLPRSMLTGDKLYVMLTATPTGASYTDLGPIWGLFDIAIKPDASATGWHIESTDNRANAIGEYAGYNFRLSGSGAGTVTLGWDASKLEINEIFKDSVSAAAPGSLPAGWSGMTAVQFHVDAASKNNYDIQFYPASAGAVASWNDVEVQMTFDEDVAP